MDMKAKKKFYKKWWFWVIAVVIIGAIGSGGGDKDGQLKNGESKQTIQQNKNELTSSDKELLKKNYKDFNVEQRTQFAEIEDKYKKMSDTEKEKVKSDFEKLSKERDIQVAEWAKQEEAEKKAEAAAEAKKQEEFIKKNSKQLSAGEHLVGTHLDPGVYDITFNGSGNFVVNGSDNSLLSNEVGGSDIGVSKYRAILTEGSKIKISGMSINTKPVKRTLMSYSNVSLYAGYWIVGQDITEGRYKVTSTGNGGNFVVYGGNGSIKINEILGGDIGVKEVVINLNNNDIIRISGINNAKFTPTN